MLNDDIVNEGRISRFGKALTGFQVPCGRIVDLQLKLAVECVARWPLTEDAHFNSQRSWETSRLGTDPWKTLSTFIYA